VCLVDCGCGLSDADRSAIASESLYTLFYTLLSAAPVVDFDFDLHSCGSFNHFAFFDMANVDCGPSADDK